MTPELGDALAARVREIDADPSVRAVVLAGDGDVFSAGGDLKMLERLRTVPFADARAFMSGFYQRYLSILDLRVPVVAGVRGAAVGAGLCVALAADVLVVDEDARLALNFVQLGLHPGMGATHLVAHRVGHQRAAELLLSGRRFGGRDAAQWGLALEAVPAASVVERAQALAASFAASAPLAVQGVTHALRPRRDLLLAALDHEAHQQAISYASADLAEGLASAAQKRPPAFVGR